MKKQGIGPWTIIGWIVLGMFLLAMYSCSKTAMRVASAASDGSPGSIAATASSEASYKVKLVDSGCQDSPSGSYTVIRATVENTGANTIPFAKAFFEAYDSSGKLLEARDTYFSPHDIPPGSRASADVMIRGDVARCGLIRMQGARGEPVALN